jgi:beta-galactosidase
VRRNISLFNSSIRRKEMKRELINNNWTFRKPGELETPVTLPHTWNGLDGQDGGNDYFRGDCVYTREITPVFSEAQSLYLECEAANSVATVFIDGKEIGKHRGGYSTFRFDLTSYVTSGKTAKLEIHTDNAHYDDIYPQMADFTFFGGLYRDVYLLTVESVRFSLDDHGSSGIYVHQIEVTDKSARLEIEFLITLADQSNNSVEVQTLVYDRDGFLTASVKTAVDSSNSALKQEIVIEDPQLWMGRENPYLYTVEVLLFCEGELTDTRRIPTGLRSFTFSADSGLTLNGKHLPLNGVSRHQDRNDKGWAISRGDMEEDMDLICEMGATSIRLAHYQHNRYFYDLCDQRGIVAWAEIPYISTTSPTDFTGENAKSQMTELIKQNFNHPSILIWGVQNEITIGGKDDSTEDIVSALNRLTKELDPSRPTAQAQVGHHPDDDSMNKITDLVGYNQYFGWYYKEAKDMGVWLDNFHKNNPTIPIGLTEYGAEAVLTYHNDNPKRSDYSEEYQTYLHHVMVQTWNSRPWIWGTYVWNMFDFASDLRDEGGVKGMNNKGLVSHDRSIRKDSFYIYKSFWSKEPVLHIASRRYVNRLQGKTDIKIITNLGQAELFMDGQSLGVRKAVENMVVFEGVKLKKGEHSLVVRALVKNGANQTGINLPESAGYITDSCLIRGVAKPDPSYIAPPSKGIMDTVANWFDDDGSEALPLEFPEGMLSIKDKIGIIIKSEEGEAVLKKYMAPLFEHAMFPMLKGFTIEKMAGMQADKFPASFISKVNRELTQIKKD